MSATMVQEYSPKYEALIAEDFMGGGIGGSGLVGSNGFIYNGTPSMRYVPGRPGIFRITSAAAADNYYVGTNASLAANQPSVSFQAGASIPSLLNANLIDYSVGFHFALVQSYAYFLIDFSTYGDYKLRAVIDSGFGPPYPFVSDPVVVAPASWHRFEIIISGNGGTVQMYLDNVLLLERTDPVAPIFPAAAMGANVRMNTNAAGIDVDTDYIVLRVKGLGR